MNRPSGSSDDLTSGAATVREERIEQAALAALIRVAKLVDAERLSAAAIDAALAGQWRHALRLSGLKLPE